MRPAQTLLLLLLSACGGNPRPSDRVEALERQQEVTRTLLEAMAKEHATVQDGPQTQPGQTDCLGWVWPHVRRTEGSTCDDYQAEISGHSTRCVEKCDTEARLAEINTAAAATCKAWCAARGCDTSQYTPLSKCGADACVADDTVCDDPRCPLLNYCFLLLDNHLWNCTCLEL